MTRALRCFLKTIPMIAMVWLSGCATLPEAGPSTAAVMNNGQAPAPGATAGYQLVDLTAQAADALTTPAPPSTGFSALPPAASLGRIGIGDLLRITLWEPDPTGARLLTPPGLDVALRVDPSGQIDLPYVGALHVAGRTAMQVQRAIIAALAAQGHEIQAAVLDSDDVSDSAMIAGQIDRPGAYKLAAETDHLLDLIALAGGPRRSEFDISVQLRRGDAVAKMPLSDIMADPALDIALQPGDSVLLEPRDLAFYAFGAVNRPGLFPYDSARISLIEALAELSGLQDNLAAPRGVFIYRRVSGARYIYRLDLSRPEAFFIAGDFVVQPGDIIYVSDAPVADLSKVLATISGIGGVAGMPRNFGAPY